MPSVEIEEVDLLVGLCEIINKTEQIDRLVGQLQPCLDTPSHRSARLGLASRNEPRLCQIGQVECLQYFANLLTRQAY